MCQGCLYIEGSSSHTLVNIVCVCACVCVCVWVCVFVCVYYRELVHKYWKNNWNNKGTVQHSSGTADRRWTLVSRHCSNPHRNCAGMALRWQPCARCCKIELGSIRGALGVFGKNQGIRRIFACRFSVCFVHLAPFIRLFATRNK